MTFFCHSLEASELLPWTACGTSTVDNNGDGDDNDNDTPNDDNSYLGFSTGDIRRTKLPDLTHWFPFLDQNGRGNDEDDDDDGDGDGDDSNKNNAKNNIDLHSRPTKYKICQHLHNSNTNMNTSSITTNTITTTSTTASTNTNTSTSSAVMSTESNNSDCDQSLSDGQQRQRQRQTQHQQQQTNSIPPPDVILKEALMEELQEHLPFSKQGESFWLQYSLVRDGSSLETLIQKVQHSDSYSILAIETCEGEVFGAFVTHPWHISSEYYGSGQSFLWRISPNNDHPNHDDQNQNHNHSNAAIATTTTTSTSTTTSTGITCEKSRKKEKVEVFKFAYFNHNIQYCQADRLVVGGSGEEDNTMTPMKLLPMKDNSIQSTSSVPSLGTTYSTETGTTTLTATTNSTATETIETQPGFGLWLQSDLTRGSSSPCSTFNSPPLSRLHSDGTFFEIRNVEVWTLTPCISVAQAIQSQAQRKFVAFLQQGKKRRTTIQSLTTKSQKKQLENTHLNGRSNRTGVTTPLHEQGRRRQHKSMSLPLQSSIWTSRKSSPLKRTNYSVNGRPSGTITTTGNGVTNTVPTVTKAVHSWMHDDSTCEHKQPYYWNGEKDKKYLKKNRRRKTTTTTTTTNITSSRRKMSTNYKDCRLNNENDENNNNDDIPHTASLSSTDSLSIFGTSIDISNNM